MQSIHPNKAGLALGALTRGWHFLWGLSAALGMAQPLIDFIFWMHFIKPVYVVGTFSSVTALILIAVTSGVGYALGWIFGVLWNWIHR